jgi:2-oxoglutarate ferredoxin oxidoreductase subunit alpha
MVAMNAETLVEDVASVSPGGYLLYDNSKPLAKTLRRDDIHEIGIPNRQYDAAGVHGSKAAQSV